MIKRATRMNIEPPSIVSVEAAAKTLRRLHRNRGLNTTFDTVDTPPTLRLARSVERRESHIGRVEQERRSTPWYRRWFGPFGFEVRNYTRFFARVLLKPEPHVGPATNMEVDVGVTGLGNLGYKATKAAYGDAHGNDIYLEPRGFDETTGNSRQNRQLVRVETKEVYATVLLLDTQTYKWVCVIPSKKVSSHYNFNILDYYGRMMAMLTGPPTTESALQRTQRQPRHHRRHHSRQQHEL